MIDLSQILLIEFSISQKCFHVDPIDYIIGSNMKTILDRKQGDYLLVGIAGCYDQATQIIAKLRDEFKIDDYMIYTNVKGEKIVTSN